VSWRCFRFYNGERREEVGVPTGDDGGESGGGHAGGDLLSGGAPREAGGAPPAEHQRSQHLAYDEWVSCSFF
jgi:hypothetical protein